MTLQLIHADWEAVLSMGGEVYRGRVRTQLSQHRLQRRRIQV
jgi:hypothetical protein